MVGLHFRLTSFDTDVFLGGQADGPAIIRFLQLSVAEDGCAPISGIMRNHALCTKFVCRKPVA
jgi:hypothetical protein